MQRASNGRVSRLKNGYWPFAAPPVGYLRDRISAKEYIDKIDPEK